MAKLSKDELIAKYSEKIEDLDLVNELLEDIADSFDFDDSSFTSEIERLNKEVENVKQKYKERFMTPSESVEEDVVEDGVQEEEVIDIKELDFSKKED